MAGWIPLLGWMGFVLVVFGLIGVVLQLVTGGVFWSRDQIWIWGNFGIGIVLLGFALVSGLDNLRERMRSGEARRAGRYGTSAILGTIIGIALLAMLAFLSTRYHTRWDWTEAGSHSLSGQTLKVLDSLDRDVEVTAFYTATSAVRPRDLLDRYEYVSDRFQVTYADPQAQPGLVRSLGVSEEKLAGGLVHVAIGDESVELDELSEESLTNAMVKLTRLDQKKAYFLEGHNERPVKGEGAEAGEGFAFAVKALENENYLWEPLFLAQRGQVPEDADIVIVAGATRPLHESERRSLDAYLARGGALLVMIDPRARTNLHEDLAAWGVLVGDDVVVDRMQGLFGRPMSPFAAEYAAHPITEGLREATLFHVARSVQRGPDANGEFTVLVRTGEQSWAERSVDDFFESGRAELGDEDLAGPVPVAVAVVLTADEGEEEAPAKAGRLVVFGDSDFATNQLIEQFRNRDLFVNSVNWLLGDVEAISIRPQPARASRLRLSGEQFMQIRYLSLFVLPEVVALLGVYAWWSRRRAPGR